MGSFLNVCIYRLPKSESVIHPRSHCPDCNRTIRWYDNIPLVSYIILRGRCRHCGSRISFRYFLVELATATVFVLFFHFFGGGLIFWIYAALACGLIIATFVDLGHQMIPDEITLGGLGVGLALSLIYPPLHGLTSHKLSIFSSFLGALVGGGSLYIIGFLGNLAFKKESMGGGDVKLLAMIGAFVGWKLVLLTFFISPLFGSIVGIVLKIKKRIGLIPYGPFLSLGAIISIIWGKQIIRWLFY